MAVSRRRLLALGAGAAAGGLGLAGCGSQRSLGRSDEITMWAWDRSVSDELVARAETEGIPGAEGFRVSRTNVGGNYNTKVRTTLAGKSMVPDIIGINADVATYFTNQDMFIDLNDFGAAELKSMYLDWKWNQCITPEGRMIAFPMDTGPTGLYYRTDLLKEAGITTDPEELAARAPDWDGFIALGKELQKSQERAVICPNLRKIWDVRMGQLGGDRYMTEDGQYIGDRDEIREIFELGYRVSREGLSAGALDGSSDVEGVVASGRQPVSIGATWWGLAYPEAVAPDTEGKWRVTTPPGGAGNEGGSFLAITKYSKNPEAAFTFISWLQSPENQVTAFTEMSLFPSSPLSFEMPEMREPRPFYGGQRTIEVFAPSAREVKTAYRSPYDRVIDPIMFDEMANVDAGKSVEAAWKDAQDDIERELTREGVF
ncbi:ABC transporter substrate-binding protein [Streptomyces synnematoformans]|uniref:Extracellular solute-binding protein n=1 Tax=Streptomyces synnematoformans TaxID=415721 RepID=A0ABN2YIQ3_9ACTN